MAVEIKELVIRVGIDYPAQAGNTAEDSEDSPQNQEAIVNACVKQVLKILKQKQKR